MNVVATDHAEITGIAASHGVSELLSAMAKTTVTTTIAPRE